METVKKTRFSVENRSGRSYWYVSYLLSNIAAGITVPLIPLFIVLYLHSNVEYVGITSSLASAAAVPSLIVWGNLSDSLKKRKVFVLIGFLGSAASLLPIVIIRSLNEYIAILVVFQVLAMASVPVSTLLILENSSTIKWPQVMASFNMISTVGTVVGLIAGTVIILSVPSANHRILPLIYLAAALIYLAAFVSALFLLVESKEKVKRGILSHLYTVRTIERIRYFPSHILHIASFRKPRVTRRLTPSMKKYLFASSFLMIGFQLFMVPYPVFVMNKFNAEESQIFLMYLFNSALSATTFKIAGLSVRRLGSTRTLSFSLYSRIIIFVLASFIPFVALPNMYYLPIFITFYAVLGGLWSFISISEVTSVSKMSLQKHRGRAVGYYNSLLGVGQIIGASASGFIAFSLGYSIDFIISAVIVMIGTVIILRINLWKDHVEMRSRNNSNS